MNRALSAFLMAALSLGLNSCVEPLPPGAPPGVPVPNNAFGATGTIRRHNPKDRCPEGDINYYLHLGGDLLVRLSARGSLNDIRALERGIRTGELVYVGGRRYPSPSAECYYMLVNRVVPLGVMPEKKRPRTHISASEPEVTKVTKTTTTTTTVTPVREAPVTVVVPVSPDPIPVTVVPKSLEPASAPTPTPAARPVTPRAVTPAPRPATVIPEAVTPAPPAPAVPGSINPLQSPGTGSGVPGSINPAPSSGSGGRLKL